ncbi:unnamed protein product [Angiostrongylus costaricensis]|uniref:Uncharacterized protein n=1 Tax=Angiostrongylus costaricensis TaxID=334426 RepID=A0A0R3PL43_ANGCS|nr:unnamed protein product [Angiostrongylus costaricensis]
MGFFFSEYARQDDEGRSPAPPDTGVYEREWGKRGQTATRVTCLSWRGSRAEITFAIADAALSPENWGCREQLFGVCLLPCCVPLGFLFSQAQYYSLIELFPMPLSQSTLLELLEVAFGYFDT